VLPRLGRRWDGYRKVRGIVCKRLRRRLQTLALADLEAYRGYLGDHPGEWANLDALCAIPISRFYRDRSVFNALGRSILPALVQAARARTTLECWSAGCASGEEPYGLAILWGARMQPRFPQIGLHVVATDVDAQMLVRAREAVYAASSLRELPADLRAAGFEPVEGNWRVRDRFRDVDFLCQDLRDAMPEGPFDLVLCRNVVLTYYAPPVQLAIMRRIVDRLRPGGALVVGIHEVLPEALGLLAPWPGIHGVYRREFE
jgi:chemotaxis protein methyltransferase CheR